MSAFVLNNLVFKRIKLFVLYIEKVRVLLQQAKNLATYVERV
jgi:hypothetical protein